MTSPQVLDKAVTDCLERWLKGEYRLTRLFGGGRNSQVYHVDCQPGGASVLKLYFRDLADSRDRLGTEFGSLSFLWDAGVRNIPRPLAADAGAKCALYSFVPGAAVTSDDVGEADIDVTVAFLRRLKELGAQPAAARFAPASEACFSAGELFDNLERRRRRLDGPAGEGPNQEALRAFLTDGFDAALAAIRRQGREQAWSERVLAAGERTLSPSDFGFHNALRLADRSLAFLDFEYFGWDDPAKTLCDFLLHPAMKLSGGLKRRFTGRFAECFGGQPYFAERAAVYYRLFALKWCLIMLNEFLPDQWDRRLFAGSAEGERWQSQHNQLAKAQKMLEEATEGRNQLESFLSASG